MDYIAEGIARGVRCYIAAAAVVGVFVGALVVGVICWVIR